jgi:hypothetical protein
MSSSFLFIITPVSNLAEGSLGDFETAMRDALGTIEVRPQNVSSQTSSFFRESGGEGRPRFLWLMQLDLSGPDEGAASLGIATALQQAKAQLKSHAEVSAGFKLTDFAV